MPTPDFTKGVLVPIDSGKTQATVQVPAGVTIAAKAYATDVYGNNSPETDVVTVDTDAGKPGLTDPDSGIAVIYGNTDPAAGTTGAEPFLASHWKRGIINGDFHDGTPTPANPIDNATNKLPGWTLVDGSLGSMVPTWVPDTTTGSGGHVEFAISAGAIGSIYLEQDVQIRSTITRNNAFALVVSAAEDVVPSSGRYGIDIRVQEYDSTGTLLGTTLVEDFDLFDLSVTQDFIAAATEGVQASTHLARVQFGILSIGPADQPAITVSLYETEMVEGTPVSVWPDVSTPTNPPIIGINQSGELGISGRLSAASMNPVVFTFPQAATPAQTAEGEAVWDIDDDKLTIGTGGGRVTLLGSGDVATVATSGDHADLTDVLPDQHHAKSHGHTGADGSGTVAHSATTGRTANDHHNQSHDHSAAGDGTSLAPASLTLPSLGYGLSGATSPAIGLSSLEAFATAAQAISGTAYADVTGVTLTIDNPGTWLVLANCVGDANNNAFLMNVALTNGGNGVLAEASQNVPASGTAGVINWGTVHLAAIVSGQSVVKLRAARGTAAPTNNWNTVNGAAVGGASNANDASNKGTSIRAVRIA